MTWNAGIKTFTAYEDLEARRRVKIKSGTTATPPEVEYADAGEDWIGVTEYAVLEGQPVAVKLNNAPGSFEIECDVSSEIARGTVLYGANDGKVSDASNGSAQGIALEAGEDDAIIEVAVWNVKANTAANTTIEDTDGFTLKATVEAALAEIYQHLVSAQATIPIPLGSLTLEDGTAITKFSAGDSATPGFSQESDKEVVLRWNNHATPGAVAFSIPMPQDLDESKDLVIHWLAKMSDANDTPDLVAEAYFDAGDTDCAGTDDEIDGGTSLAEYTNTIDAADVPASPSVLTVVFGPKSAELGTDDCLVYGVWLEYTRKILTA